MRAVGETETTQETIQDWFELDEGDPGFQLVFLQFLYKASTVKFFIYFHQHNVYYYIFHSFIF
jgi:hypothetical protein